MKMPYYLNMFVIINLLICLSCLEPEEDKATPGAEAPEYQFNWTAIADSSVTSLNHNFWNGTKFYNYTSPPDGQFHYWPQAHALDVLVDAFVRTSDNQYRAYMDDWFIGVKMKNGGTFINHYYDDMEWNALAMLRAYEATGDRKWLDASVELWVDIRGGWNEIMGGGISWNKELTGYKNTPANAPACILAARLYQQTKTAGYLDWAKKIYAWQNTTLVDAGTGLVYDGINRDNDGKLQNDPGWSFAYNQGTFIGAAIELFNITSDQTYLQDAIRTANTFIAHPVMSPGGIMRSSDNGDGGLFNGIGARYLALLTIHPEVPASARENYVLYLKKNAETLWLKGTERPKVIFNSDFTKLPGSTGYLTPQLSGCMLMEAMALLKRKNYVQ